MADTPDTNEVRLHGQFTQVDENGDVTVLYPNTTVDDITGILPIEKGGTGSSSEQDFVQNIINNILNNSDLTDISKLYSKFITVVDERPTNLNSFTNPGWYYFTSSTAPEGYQNHPAIYNGDATEPTAGFLFVMTVRYKTCQFWISANYIGTTGNKKRCIYQREASINSELSQNWSKWTYLHGDSNATQVYYVTYKGDSSIEYMYQDTYPGEAAIFKYETVDGSYTQHNGDIIIAECNFPETVKEIQLQIDDTEPTQIYTDSKGSSAVKLDNNNYKKITNGIYIFLYRTRVYHVIGQLHSTFNLATNGLVPKPDSTDTTKFLRGDGTWVIPDNTTYTLMGNSTNTGWEVSLTPSSGSSTSTIVPTFSGSSSGLVPKPSSGDTTKFLNANGGWTEPTGTYTHPSYTAKTPGLYKITVNNTGHVSAATAVTKDDITELGIPDEDTTYSVFSTSANGLVPKPSSASTTKFLNANGGWTEPTGTTYSTFSATANGLVPKPGSSSGNKYLDANGGWSTPIGTTYSVFSATANGLVPRPDSSGGNKFLNANGGWSTPTNTTYTTFTQATENTAGTAGLVPGPPTNTYPDTTSKFLNSAGGWSTPTGPDTYTQHSSGLYKIANDKYGHIISATAVTNSDMTTVYGTGNSTDNDTTFIVGNNNELYTTSNQYRSYVLGSRNKIGTSSNQNIGSVVFGFDNDITESNTKFCFIGNNNTAKSPFIGSAAWSFGFGVGLNVPDHHGVYIGRYNDDSTHQTEEAHESTPASQYNGYTAFCIGNGRGSTYGSYGRSNAFRITFTGATYGSSWNASGADYAEFVKPWFDGNVDNEDRVGYMVTIKDGYLHKANEGDYIIGITSGAPSVVGNADETYYWKYERDEFNRIIYELVDEIKEETDENGNKITVKTGNKISVPKVSSNYDVSLAHSYVERKNRPEWSYVGMRGIVPVRDDGTCEAGGFCKCGTDGIATKSERGLDTYYVIERINDHVISVEVK